MKIILMNSCDVPFSHFHCSCAQKFLPILSVLTVLGIFKSVQVVVHKLFFLLILALLWVEFIL